MKIFIKTQLIASLLAAVAATAQTPYTSYFTGDTTDAKPAPLGGTVLMGGATEDDNAMRWFLQRANGGDVVVIRASGSNGYNTYLFSELGITVNSVESIVTTTEAAALDPYVARQIRNAEALWIAGGDQWNYVRFWKNKAVGQAIQYLIDEKKAVVGGTSAGMAILSDAYFDAKNGTVTSAQALANPFDAKVSLGYSDFLKTPFLKNVVTDTHYDDPDRRGRHMTFLARLTAEHQQRFFGIACEEYTAVCIAPDGVGRVFGSDAEIDVAYFLQVNCKNNPFTPEKCESGSPLDWQRGQQAVKVFAARGTAAGANTFDLKDWKTGTGGTWHDWWIENGVLKTADNAVPADCTSAAEDPASANFLKISPNPAADFLQVEFAEGFQFEIFDLAGNLKMSGRQPSGSQKIEISDLPAGVFVLKILAAGEARLARFSKI